MSSPLLIEPGSRIGQHAIEKQIAQGGFGTIWRAVNTTSGQPVALKILHSHLVSTESLVQRFELEAETIKRMQHPNIIKLHECGRLPDGRPYLVMELLEGLDLEAHVALRGTLSPREVLPILEQLCAALTMAHAHGVVHRDIKPSNVFLADQGGSVRVVLFDFGVAKLLDTGGPQVTASSALIGSPAGMSPEQIQGLPVDARADVYGLGSLVHHMLVGYPPFRGATVSAVLTMHVEDEPPLVSCHGYVSPAFDGVVLTAMSKQPAQRFASVMGFLDAYRQALRTSENRTRSTTASPAVVEALGIHIDVHADSAALDNDDEPDDSLLDDMDAIMPFVVRGLTERSYGLAYEHASSALAIRLLDTDAQAKLRERAVNDARDLFTRLGQRPGQDKRVRVCMVLHLADVQLSPDGTVEDAVLRDAGQWRAADLGEGLFVSAEVLRGIAASDAYSELVPGLYRVA